MLKSREVLIKKQDRVSKHLMSSGYSRCFKVNSTYYAIHLYPYEVYYSRSHNFAGNFCLIEDTFFIQIDTPVAYA